MSDQLEESSSLASPGSTTPPRRLFAARGDPTNPYIFSGTPYYFLKAAIKGGILDAPVPLPRDGIDFHLRRILWNVTRPLTFDHRGGYQYVPARRNRQWAGVRRALGGTCLLSAWQLFPRFVVDDDSIEKWFFIDQTLSQLYDEYKERDIIGRRIAHCALVEERQGYKAATGIIVHSRWAADSVIDDYGIDPGKVYVVTQAANIDDAAYSAWEAQEQVRRLATRTANRPDRPLRLVFAGLDGRRKGLDRLLRGLVIARRDGSRATLRVIGCTPKQMPPELRSLAGVEWYGSIDKRKEGDRFLRLLGECDVGVLLSRVEAGGCGLSEYQATGLAVLGTNAGGAAEQILPGNGLTVDTGAAPVEIAHILLRLEREPELLHGMRQSAWRQRRAATWSARVAEIRKFWPHPD
ncbi:MAG: glycosyltransferase family 4 protein [Actinomycetota bacterium]|nr:glycosyltransferase family 4 protein [Actinomycetota bacterium]